MAIQMELSRILIREGQESHVVELREVDGGRVFPIVIGPTEAMAIERRLMGKLPPRPQTHELLATIVEQLGAKIDHILINDLHEHTFFARLYLKRDNELFDIDCRPSDAIALGIATEIPIFVEDHVIENATKKP